MEESTFLTKFADEVTLIHRREQFRASRIMLDRARNNPKIKFLLDTVVERIHDPAQGTVTGVKLKNVKTGRESDFGTDGLFLAIGHVPNTGVFRGQIAMDGEGYVTTSEYVRTSVEGVFAAGDVQDRIYRQAISAAGSGCMAAMAAEKWLEAQH